MASSKEKVTRGLMIAAMVTPPWNIACWTIGACIYAATKIRDRDNKNGDAFLELVIGAPVTLPIMPILAVQSVFARKRIKRTEMLCANAAEWIAEQLRSERIEVEKVESVYEFIQITARPTTVEQFAAYQAVYASAIRTFPMLTPRIICGSAMPLEPLDRAWAERNGFPLFAVELESSPCVDCQQVESLGCQFGPDLEKHHQHERNRFTRYILKDGTTREVTGYLCSDCFRKLDPASSASYN